MNRSPEVTRAVIDVMCYGLRHKDIEIVKNNIKDELEKKDMDIDDISYSQLLDLIRSNISESMRAKQRQLVDGYKDIEANDFNAEIQVRNDHLRNAYKQTHEELK